MKRTSVTILPELPQEAVPAFEGKTCCRGSKPYVGTEQAAMLPVKCAEALWWSSDVFATRPVR